MSFRVARRRSGPHDGWVLDPPSTPPGVASHSHTQEEGASSRGPGLKNPVGSLAPKRADAGGTCRGVASGDAGEGSSGGGAVSTRMERRRPRSARPGGVAHFSVGLQGAYGVLAMTRPNV